MGWRMVNQIKPKHRKWTPKITGMVDRDKYDKTVIGPYEHGVLTNEVTPSLGSHSWESEQHQRWNGNIKAVTQSLLEIEPLNCFHENMVDQHGRKVKYWVKQRFLLLVKGPSHIYNLVVFANSTCEWVWADELLPTLLGDMSRNESKELATLLHRVPGIMRVPYLKSQGCVPG